MNDGDIDMISHLMRLEYYSKDVFSIDGEWWWYRYDISDLMGLWFTMHIRFLDDIYRMLYIKYIDDFIWHILNCIMDGDDDTSDLMGLEYYYKYHL